jgi:uncharacterized protein YkwD
MVAARRITALLGLLVLGLALVSSSRAGPSSMERLTTLEPQIVREINRVRDEQGLRPLKVSTALRATALGHTQAMLRGGFFDHTWPDGTTVSDRIQPSYPMRPNRVWTVGEVLFATSGTLTPREAVTRWLASPSHREILLSPTWRDVGIGVVRSPLARGDFGNLPATAATADFGAR